MGEKMAKAPTVEAQVETRPICGIIMPIAAMPPKYDASHWIDVRRVIDAAIIKADMTPQIVSDSFEGDVIQRRIINNLYDNPVVVCDVSGLNPNVMFELGMRITFKQPVVIITDDYDTIPFDTRVIEHLGYPQDLHIHHTTDFIEKLADRIKRLHEQKISATFTSFIEEFGTFEVLEPSKKVVPAEQLILDRLTQIEARLSRSSEIRMMAELHRRSHSIVDSENALVDYKFIFKRHVSMEQITEVSDYLRRTYRGSPSIIDNKNGHFIVSIILDSSYNFDAKATEKLLNAMPGNFRDVIQQIDIILG
ncbi:hypothetical protein [Sphingobium sp. ba1]|jgi:hypothetical protein|uniref:hypothetical protein n=1 Tax=Sphingobium sp. ba1 TaxID=1522072 RepID=UPI00068D8520|nr:hypothetical protein [Sphingobium sp. ba1]